MSRRSRRLIRGPASDTRTSFLSWKHLQLGRSWIAVSEAFFILNEAVSCSHTIILREQRWWSYTTTTLTLDPCSNYTSATAVPARLLSRTPLTITSEATATGPIRVEYRRTCCGATLRRLLVGLKLCMMRGLLDVAFTYLSSHSN